MPIYEYRCQSCQEKFEKLVRSIGSTEQVVCPSCGSSFIERLLSMFGRVGMSRSTADSSSGFSCSTGVCGL